MNKTFKFRVTTKVIPIHCIHVKNKRLECGDIFYVCEEENELKEIQGHLKKGYIEALGEMNKATLLINIDCDGVECGNCRYQSYVDEVGCGKICKLFGERINLKRCESCLKAGESGDKAMETLDIQNIRSNKVSQTGNFSRTCSNCGRELGTTLFEDGCVCRYDKPLEI